ncbi:MAG TPA: hypothetical protein DDX06_03005 [Curvibacter sp.]|nr:hypothetical protein [Curvibacter sp.]
MKNFRVLVPLLIWGLSALASAHDARERGFIRMGMTEGEVLVRVGKPDHEAWTGGRVRGRDGAAIVQGRDGDKTWTYFPHEQDPDTLTVITFRAGTVVDVERKISR